MEINDQLKKRFATNPQKSQYLHSPNHLLADELSQKLNEPGRFGFYLKMAEKYDHGILRRIAGEVTENGKAKKPGALFAFLIKKEFSKNDTADNQIPK
ncbi:MAG: hypothetical protein JWO40_574 [Candidatus Doudnabacteria bacterium]|nr:hypothetical protein [Candidatus Doudnabacteria bacterium]